MGQLKIQSAKGHEVMGWDATKLDTLLEPRSKFKEFSECGWLSFKIEPETKEPTQIDDFDPFAEIITMIAPISGG